jgi:predicted transcriptional regulator
MISPSQIKGARAMLGLTQTELATAAGITKTALVNIETATSDPKSSTLSAIQKALESAGVEFIAENGGGPGVRLRKRLW